MIDAVQARIAAAAPGETEPTGENGPAPVASARRGRSLDNKRELFKNLRVETSLENADNNLSIDVECNVTLPQFRTDGALSRNGAVSSVDGDNQATDGRRSSDAMQKSSRTLR